MKRAVCSSLWFLSIVCLYELLVSVVGAPRLIGPTVGMIAAILVFVDPGGRIWATQSASVGDAIAAAGRPHQGRGDTASTASAGAAGTTRPA